MRAIKKSLPNDRLPNNVIAQFEYLDTSSSSGSGLYTISIDKLESRNTIKFDNEKDCKLFARQFATDSWWIESIEEI